MKKTLVAYFSAGGVTAKLAETLASAIGADLFEIKPQKPYSDADLKWTNPLARCNREKFGKKDVPLAQTVQDMNAYDTVFIGFPIWYYAAPNVVETFAKGYDWSEKTVALFASSGGSEMGKTAEKLLPFLKGCEKIAADKRFAADADEATLLSWAKTVIEE